jgi:excisionase family DNA binding protein
MAGYKSFSGRNRDNSESEFGRAATNMNSVESFLTVGEVAQRLALSARQVRRLVKSRELRAHRFGRALRISAADFDAYVGRNRMHRKSLLLS